MLSDQKMAQNKVIDSPKNSPKLAKFWTQKIKFTVINIKFGVKLFFVMRLTHIIFLKT